MGQHGSKLFRLYMCAIGLLGWCVLVWLTFSHWRALARVSLLWEAGFFLALAILVGLHPVRLPGRGGAVTTVGFAVDYACLLIFGPIVAGWNGIISETVLLWRSPGLRKFFNQGQLALSFVGAGLAYEALGGKHVMLAPSGKVAFGGMGFPLLAAGLAYFAISSMLIATAMALWERRSVPGMWLVAFRWTAPRYLALAPFGLLMAMVYQIEGLGVFAVALFLVPLVGARYAFQGAMEMLDVHRQTVYALSNALEAYDAYTSGHSKLVTRYALQLGTELGLSAARLEVLEWAGQLHDIGKLRRDWDSIIKKPGKPSPHEWEVIRQHPIEGSRVAEAMEFLPNTQGQVARIVRSHHERLDGSGYPNGDGGSSISLEARILAVADAFEAMTAPRAYHRRRSPEDAIVELKRCAGTQFDPGVVEAVANLFERGELRVGDALDEVSLASAPPGAVESKS